MHWQIFARNRGRSVYKHEFLIDTLANNINSARLRQIVWRQADQLEREQRWAV